MKYGDSTHEDTDMLRAHMRSLVDDVEPRGDALASMLSAVRRRKAPRNRVVTVVGLTVAITAAFLVVLVIAPQAPPQTAPVSVAPNSYVAQPRPGVIAAFDVASGRQIRQLASVSGQSRGSLVADGDKVYTVVSKGNTATIVEVFSNGAQRNVAPSEGMRLPAMMAAGGDMLAYLDRDSVVLSGGSARHRIPVPPGVRVAGLALGHDGRLAILTESAGNVAIYLADTTTTSLSQRKPIRPYGGCGSLAIAWRGSEVAALSPTTCDPVSTVRVATFNPDNGEQVAAGVPFSTGPLNRVQLSADRLGRFLVSDHGARQWIVDGGDVRLLPPACAPDGSCSALPATFWG